MTPPTPDDVARALSTPAPAELEQTADKEFPCIGCAHARACWSCPHRTEADLPHQEMATAEAWRQAHQRQSERVDKLEAELAEALSERNETDRAVSVFRAGMLAQIEAGEMPPIVPVCGWCGVPTPDIAAAREHSPRCEQNPAVIRAVAAEWERDEAKQEVRRAEQRMAKACTRREEWRRRAQAAESRVTSLTTEVERLREALALLWEEVHDPGRAQSPAGDPALLSRPCQAMCRAALPPPTEAEAETCDCGAPEAPHAPHAETPGAGEQPAPAPALLREAEQNAREFYAAMDPADRAAVAAPVSSSLWPEDPRAPASPPASGIVTFLPPMPPRAELDAAFARQVAELDERKTPPAAERKETDR